MDQQEIEVVTLRANPEHNYMEKYVPLFGAIGVIIVGVIFSIFQKISPNSNPVPAVVVYGAYFLGIGGFIYWLLVQKPNVEWNSKNGRLIFYPDHLIQRINKKDINVNYSDIKEIRVIESRQQTRGSNLVVSTTHFFISIVDQNGKIITTFNTKTYDMVMEYLVNSPLQHLITKF